METKLIFEGLHINNLKLTEILVCYVKYASFLIYHYIKVKSFMCSGMISIVNVRKANNFLWLERIFSYISQPIQVIFILCLYIFYVFPIYGSAPCGWEKELPDYVELSDR